MLPIMVEQQPADERLEQLGVKDWAVWSCEVAQFPWQYDQREVCYLLEGQAVVTPADGGAPVEIGVGDLVVFPAGMSCQWEVLQPLRKQYRIG
jgi:uncharacterized protein